MDAARLLNYRAQVWDKVFEHHRHYEINDTKNVTRAKHASTRADAAAKEVVKKLRDIESPREAQRIADEVVKKHCK